MLCNFFAQIEQESIARSIDQEERVITVRRRRIGVDPEALSKLVVVVINPSSRPAAVALDAKVIVGLDSQSPLPKARLE